MKTDPDWSNLQKEVCYSATKSSSLLMSRKSAWLHLVKHLRQNQRNCTGLKIMSSWKSDDLLDHHTWNLVAGLFTLPLIRWLSGLQFRLLMRSDRLTKTTLQTLNDNFISAEKLLVSRTHMTARLCWSEDRHRRRKSKEGEFRKRSRDNWVRDRRAKKNAPLVPVLSVSEAPSGMKSYLGQNIRGEENQTINRPPTEINSALSGSLSWHILEKCLPLLSHKRPFPPNLSPDRGDTRLLKPNSTLEGLEYAIILSQKSNTGASFLQDTPPRMAGMSRENQISSVDCPDRFRKNINLINPL